MEVINEDYADFVSLSTQLVNVDGAVARMQKPLGDLKVRFVRVCFSCFKVFHQVLAAVLLLAAAAVRNRAGHVLTGGCTHPALAQIQVLPFNWHACARKSTVQ